MRIGIGYDVHQLIEGRPLILGGVTIEHPMGLLGHSDADVLIHAVIDAILGALGKRDIGFLFPDTDDSYKDISSLILLQRVYEIMDEEGYEIENIDAIIMAQRPKMLPHINKMEEKMASVLKIDVKRINIKATTTEKLGFVGREEGIASQAVVLLNKKVFSA